MRAIAQAKEKTNSSDYHVKMVERDAFSGSRLRVK
jgi:hypothetical protein